jgi:hypothetical protein
MLQFSPEYVNMQSVIVLNVVAPLLRMVGRNHVRYLTVILKSTSYAAAACTCSNTHCQGRAFSPDQKNICLLKISKRTQ